MSCFVPLEISDVVPAPGDERRRHERFAVSQTAKLTVISPEDSLEFVVQLVDLSRQGVGLVSPHELGDGQPVRIETEDFIVYGVVRHSSGSVPHLRVGIEVETAVTRNNRYTMRPSITGFVPL